MILLPRKLCYPTDAGRLRYILAHEWSHIERRDAWAWNLTCLAGIMLFYQPLFWWLRRQLKLCQDFLADDRAAALGSAEDYATYLVQLARARRNGVALPALGASDRRSNLYRRIAMLVHCHEPLERRCRTPWSVTTALSALLIMVTASGLRLQAGAPLAADNEATTKNGKGPVQRLEHARIWHGRVSEQGTGKPLPGTEVLVKISVSREKSTNELKTLREIPCTTGHDGSYAFSVTPAEAAEPSLYITLQVTPRDHVNFKDGYSFDIILRNEKLGKRPFFENVRLSPGKEVEGMVQTPDGKPAAGVKVDAWSSPDANQPFYNNGRFSETTTDSRGHFRLVLYPKGTAVIWMLPRDYAPEAHGLKNDRRGDLGTFTLEHGVRFGGRLLDANGKPVAGVCVKADRKRSENNEDEPVPRSVADMRRRATVTTADGSFLFGPLPPGTYVVYASEKGGDPSTREGAQERGRRPLPAVFTFHRVILENGKTPDSLEIRAVPDVVIEAQVYNSKGEKQSGHFVVLFGHIDGEFWLTECQPTADGSYRMRGPHGLGNARISLTASENSALQFRTAKGAPLQRGRNIWLGTLDHDVTGIEIVRYEAPIILIAATTKDGRPATGFRTSVDYTEVDRPRDDGKFILKGGIRSDVFLDEQKDGRYRTSQLVPDREVAVTVEADGYRPASRKVTLPEGKTEELTLVMEPN